MKRCGDLFPKPGDAAFLNLLQETTPPSGPERTQGVAEQRVYVWSFFFI